ncbi:hypothetical protein DFH27DRAFT_528002 [Peziza echinospora]|nr:hypothetical protein DFH27DRAFT_528002 [Peziza echinospora]
MSSDSTYARDSRPSGYRPSSTSSSLRITNATAHGRLGNVTSAVSVAPLDISVSSIMTVGDRVLSKAEEEEEKEGEEAGTAGREGGEGVSVGVGGIRRVGAHSAGVRGMLVAGQHGAHRVTGEGDRRLLDGLCVWCVLGPRRCRCASVCCLGRWSRQAWAREQQRMLGALHLQHDNQGSSSWTATGVLFLGRNRNADGARDRNADAALLRALKDEFGARVAPAWLFWTMCCSFERVLWCCCFLILSPCPAHRAVDLMLTSDVGWSAVYIQEGGGQPAQALQAPQNSDGGNRPAQASQAAQNGAAGDGDPPLAPEHRIVREEDYQGGWARDRGGGEYGGVLRTQESVAGLSATMGQHRLESEQHTNEIARTQDSTTTRSTAAAATQDTVEALATARTQAAIDRRKHRVHLPDCVAVGLTSPLASANPAKPLHGGLLSDMLPTGNLVFGADGTALEAAVLAKAQRLTATERRTWRARLPRGWPRCCCRPGQRAGSRFAARSAGPGHGRAAHQDTRKHGAAAGRLWPAGRQGRPLLPAHRLQDVAKTVLVQVVWAFVVSI